MLTSGMVPALYADDEKEQIIGQVSSAFHLPPSLILLSKCELTRCCFDQNVAFLQLLKVLDIMVSLDNSQTGQWLFWHV